MGFFSSFETPSGQTTLYGSTNHWMDFAIKRMDADYPLSWVTPGAGARAAIPGTQLNTVFPVEMKSLDFEPMTTVMDTWKTALFDNQTESGLIPQTLGNVIPFWAVINARYASFVNLTAWMSDFLAWFPDDLDLIGRCKAWAFALKAPNDGQGGHVAPNGLLYNWVYTGRPPAMDAAGELNDFDREFCDTFKGAPGSDFVLAQEYGAVALGFAAFAGFDDSYVAYSEWAQELNYFVWNLRFNHAVEVVPDAIMTLGAKVGDRSVDYRYMYDSDSIYWARPLFRAYRLRGGPVRLDLIPIADPSAPFDEQIGVRRALLHSVLGNVALTDPTIYLRMGLGHTIDWIIGGWNQAHNHFVRKIFHDGTAATTRLYGDALWNTLFMLVEAFRCTHDDFYLDLFETAWRTFENAAATDVRLGGLFPAELDAGVVPQNGSIPYGQPLPDPRSARTYSTQQDCFLGAVVDAYFASVEAGRPRDYFLQAAKQLAGRIERAVEGGITDTYPIQDGIIGPSLIRLAGAETALNRVEFTIAAQPATLVIDTPAPVTFDVPEGRAVIYLNDGDYAAYAVPRVGLETPHKPVHVPGDAQISLP